jgi:hypothetical protein
MIQSSSCPRWQPDRPGPAGDHDGLAVVTPLTGTRSTGLRPAGPRFESLYLYQSLIARRDLRGRRQIPLYWRLPPGRLGLWIPRTLSPRTLWPLCLCPPKSLFLGNRERLGQRLVRGWDLRTAPGRCGSLFRHRSRLAPPTRAVNRNHGGISPTTSPTSSYCSSRRYRSGRVLQRGISDALPTTSASSYCFGGDEAAPALKMR